MIPRVIPGTRPSASQQNKIVDQVNRLTTSPGEAFGSDQAGQKVFVLNRTGMDLEVGMVAPFKPGAANPYPDNPLRQISGTVGELYDPADWETEDTDGDDPPWNNWVVAAQRIPSGQSGWAYSSGIVMARVRNEEAGSASIEYQYADLGTWEEGTEGTAWFHLNRMPSGSARILWVDDAYGSGGAGEVWQWAQIRFDGVGGQLAAYNLNTDNAEGMTAKRIGYDGEEMAAEEYFFSNPECRLAIAVRTAEGRATLFKGGVKYICQLKAGEATSPINAVFEIESYDEDTETHTVIRPTEDSLPDASLVIGPARAIEAEGLFTVPMEGERWGKIEASVAVKDSAGSTADQYYLTKDNTGYKVLGYNATEGRALVRPFSSGGALTYNPIIIPTANVADITAYTYTVTGVNVNFTYTSAEIDLDAEITADGCFALTRIISVQYFAASNAFLKNTGTQRIGWELEIFDGTTWLPINGGISVQEQASGSAYNSPRGYVYPGTADSSVRFYTGSKTFSKVRGKFFGAFSLYYLEATNTMAITAALGDTTAADGLTTIGNIVSF